MQVFVLRPEPGNAATCKAAREAGLDPVAMPLQQIEAAEWQMPEGAFDGLLIGSANAIRHGGPRLNELRDLPVHAVGARTAEAAQSAGFKVATVGSGGLQAVIDTLPARATSLLRLSGEERVELDLPDHVAIAERSVYRLAPLDPSAQSIAALRQGGCALLHSASALRRLVEVCESHEIHRGTIALAALGPRILAAAGEGWHSIHTADAPSDAALLALARRICETSSRNAHG